MTSVPSACLRAFSCFIWTVRKCWRSSCHLMSSLPSLERVEERFPTVLSFDVNGRTKRRRARNIRFRCDVKETSRVHSVKAIAKGKERRTLREQHQQAVEALKQEGIFLRFE